MPSNDPDTIAEGHADVVAGAGELFAVLRALEIAAERGFARVKLRSDYNPIRRALRRDYMAG
jgi:ribonuclease HI